MASVLQTILDSTQKLHPWQVRKLFYILSTLAFSQRQEGSYIQVRNIYSLIYIKEAILRLTLFCNTTEGSSGCALVLFCLTSRVCVVQIMALSMKSD